jgi:hypothetical protein
LGGSAWCAPAMGWHRSATNYRRGRADTRFHVVAIW